MDTGSHIHWSIKVNGERSRVKQQANLPALAQKPDAPPESYIN
jgi:hypothetical protein